MDPFSIPLGTLYNEDCIRGTAAYVPDGSIDLIITDPPYGIGGDHLHRHYNRDERYVVNGYREIPLDQYGMFSRKWVRAAERILKPGGSLYVISGYTNLYHILHALRSTGLQEVNHLIWKYSFGVFTRRKYVSSHYHILFYEKPGGRRTFNMETRYGMGEKDAEGRSLNNLDREDVWVLPREYKPGTYKNKNALPLSLLVKMIQYSSNEGDLVCDLFCGGFSTARAAIGLNRRFVGFEVSEQIFQAMSGDLRNLMPGFLLNTLRAPHLSPPAHQGKRWTGDEREQLYRRYRGYQKKGLSKKESMKRLAAEMGRGRWGIEKALKGMERHRG